MPVLLKEYLPGARAVAANELQMLVHLCEGLPSRKWHAANAPMTADPPIVPILGAPCKGGMPLVGPWHLEPYLVSAWGEATMVRSRACSRQTLAY